MDKYIGRLLDNRYEILEVIGVGGMAVVYKAKCHRLNRLVAVKILKDDYFKDEEFRNRFHAESQAVAMLSHPNIVSVYDVSTSDDADYIVMELIDGISLKQYMERKGTLNWKETLHFAIQIGKALEHAHSRGIVHRDIKPHNVMVLKNGSVKVADFGIAQVMSKTNTLTKEALGSVHYISPEQARGGRVDSRSDIYSLGVVMYEMITGRPPYDGDSPVAVAIQHINGGAPMPSTINPNIPGGLEQIMMKAMTPAVSGRYATVNAMLYDMDEFRKNPTILFDYNNPDTDMDAGMKLVGEGHTSQETMQLPKTPAKERKTAAQKTAQKRPEHAKQPARKSREVIVDDEEPRGGMVATITIILCAIVALSAIVLFVYAIMNVDSTDVVVPDLVGKVFEELESEDVVIRLGSKDYNDEYPEGTVFNQNPKGGTSIPKGGVVTVYVSLGPVPEIKKMEDLSGLDVDAAKQFLMDVLGIKEDNIRVLEESNEVVPVGQVIRTNPLKNEELSDNQQITMWISTGPAVKMAKVPNVHGQSKEDALTLLKANGFNNVVFEEIKSNQPAGMVVGQSEAAQTEINVTTQIVLQISLGNQDEKPNPPVDNPPVDNVPEADPVSKVITVELPDDREEDYVLTLWCGEELLEQRTIPAGTVSTQFNVKGNGKVEFVLKIDGKVYGAPLEIDFDEQ